MYYPTTTTTTHPNFTKLLLNSLWSDLWIRGHTFFGSTQSRESKSIPLSSSLRLINKMLCITASLSMRRWACHCRSSSWSKWKVLLPWRWRQWGFIAWSSSGLYSFRTFRHRESFTWSRSESYSAGNFRCWAIRSGRVKQRVGGPTGPRYWPIRSEELRHSHCQ